MPTTASDSSGRSPRPMGTAAKSQIQSFKFVVVSVNEWQVPTSWSGPVNGSSVGDH